MIESARLGKSISAVMVFTILNLLPSLINVFLLPIYLRHLDAKDYGTLSVVSLFGGLYTVVSILQLNVSAATNYFDYNDSPKQLKKFVSSIFTASFLISTITFLIFIGVGVLFFEFIISSSKIEFLPLGLIVLITSYATQLRVVYFVIIKNEFKLMEFAVYSVLMVLLNSGLQFYLIVLRQMGVLGSVLGALISNVIMTAVLITLQRRLFDFRPDFPMIRKSLRFSIPFIPIILMTWFIGVGDRFFLEQLTDLTTVGQYALLIGLLLLADKVFSSAGNAFRPFLFQLFKRLDSESLVEVGFFFMLFVKFGLFTLSGVVLVGSNLHLITENEKYISIIPLFTLGIVALIPKVLLRIPYLQLMYIKASKAIARMTFISMVILLICFAMLIPSYGISGALYSLGISNFLNFLLFYFVAQREFRLPNKFILRASFIVIGFLMITGLLHLAYVMKGYSIGSYGIFQFVTTSTFLLILSRKQFISFLKSLLSKFDIKN